MIELEDFQLNWTYKVTDFDPVIEHYYESGDLVRPRVTEHSDQVTSNGVLYETFFDVPCVLVTYIGNAGRQTFQWIDYRALVPVDNRITEADHINFGWERENETSR